MGPIMKYTYQTMPKSEATAEGMHMIEGNIQNLRATLKEDIIYIHKDHKDLHLRILRPESLHKEADTTLYPILIHVQGSAYMKQNLKDHVLDMKEIVCAGYVVAIVEYRESAIVKMPGQVDDVKDAVMYIHEHHKELNIDPHRMFVSGDSSGGHACLMCWATWQHPLPDVRAFLDFYGAVDLVDMLKHVSAIEHFGPQSSEYLALGGDPADPKWHEAASKVSVISYIDEKMTNAPLLVLHGNKDRLVPFEQSVLLYNKAKQANKDITFYCVNNADHGGSAFYCDAVYKIILEFLKTH